MGTHLVSLAYLDLQLDRSIFKQECIPIGCIPPALVAMCGGGGSEGCRGITRIHRSPSRLRPFMRPTAAFINIHEHLI